MSVGLFWALQISLYHNVCINICRCFCFKFLVTVVAIEYVFRFNFNPHESCDLSSEIYRYEKLFRAFDVCLFNICCGLSIIIIPLSMTDMWCLKYVMFSCSIPWDWMDTAW